MYASLHIWEFATMFRKIVPLLINGVEKKTVESLIFPVLSPFNENEVLYHAQGASPSDVLTALETAQSGFVQWKATNYLQRREVLQNAARLLESRKPQFLQMMEEMAIPTWFANVNIDTSVGMIKEAASLTSQPQGSIPQTETSDSVSLVFNEPIGPVLSISPWNAPCILCTRALVAPIAAGCSVILKSSEHSPLIHYELVKLFVDAGLPPNVLSLLNSSRETSPAITETLIKSKAVKKVNFTGSTAVGKAVAKIAAENLKPVLLELGGKGTAIVTRSANLEDAAGAIVFGAFAHNGQICMSTERVFVDDAVYDDFVAILKNVADSASSSEALPQRTSTAAARASQLVESAVENGAAFVHGSSNRNGTYLTPVILQEVKSEDEIFESETFAPVFFLSRYKDVQEAIDIANTSASGLTSSVWCKDTLEGLSIARQLESGAVHINGGTLRDEPVLPHGGVKQSGSGRFNGIWGIREFQYLKTVTIS